MAHLERDEIALRAIGEHVDSPDDEGHLLDCRACREDLESLATVARIAADLAPEERVVPPAPPELFDRIEAEVAGSEPGEGGVVRLRFGRTSSRTWGLVTAAAAVVMLALVGISTLGDVAPTEDPVAAATLEPLDDRAQTTQAQLVEQNGDLVLRLTSEELPEDDGYYEVWLIDENVEGMVSLGPVDAEGGHRLPGGLDPGDFPIVDVSLEPFDGDPTHSGDSLLRGELDLDPDLDA